MTKKEITDVLKEVKFRDWDFYVGTIRDYPMYLQVRFLERDLESGSDGKKLQTGRKWLLSHHMTRSEIVLTALKAVLTAVEHEAREEFKYKGQAIFNPHWDVEALLQNSIFYSRDKRQEKSFSKIEGVV